MSVSNISQQFARFRSVGLVLLGIGVGYLAGIGSAPSSAARAEVTEEPRREAFKAGGVINEPVLREIAATLQRIENRVERIEKGVVPQAPVPLKTGNKPATKK